MKLPLVLIFCSCASLMGTDKDKPIAKSMSALKALAEKGDAKAQFTLGGLYYKGQGVGKDFREALKWYHKSAAQGYARAQFNLGVLYFKGEVGQQNFKEAMKWFREAARHGHAFAQNNLGSM